MKPRELPPPVVPTPLLPWLLTALHPMNRTRVKELLRSGRVLVNGTSTTRHDHPLTPADRVGIAPEAPPQAAALGRHGITVLYEDAHVIAIDKPSGLLTVATDGEKTATAFALLHAHHRDRPFVVHRLDRDTSGVLLFAKSPAVRDRLQEAWDSAEKTYLAVVDGVPDPPEGTVDNFLAEGKDLRVRAVRESAEHAKRAVSRYRVLSRAGRLALVEVRIETGRKHQIRVHLAGLGCPVIGDRLYGTGANPAGRLGLHARRLAFDHPASGHRVTVEAAFPVGLQKWFPHGVA